MSWDTIIVGAGSAGSVAPSLHSADWVGEGVRARRTRLPAMVHERSSVAMDQNPISSP